MDKTALTPEALRLLVSAIVVTMSPKRRRRMREVVERNFHSSTRAALRVAPEKRAAHEQVLVALEKAEQRPVW